MILALYMGEHISKDISESFLIDKFKSVNEDRCSKVLKKLNSKFIIDLYENKFDSKNVICKKIDIALDNKLFIELELYSRVIKIYPICYVLRKEGLCLYCYRNEYMMVLLENIFDIRILNEVYDSDTIGYIENKDKIKYIQ